MQGAAICLLAAAFAVLGLVAPAQEVDAETGAFHLRKDVDQVALVLSVLDSKGRFVADLRERDFQVRDNGQAPSHIDYLQPQTDLPLRLAVLIDTSDSVNIVFPQEQEAAIRFLQQTLRPDIDTAFLAGFSTQLIVVAQTPAKPGALSSAVSNLRIEGTTALLDAVAEASKRLARHRGVRQRRAIIIISDGQDNSSKRSVDAILEIALRSEVAVYALSTNEEIERSLTSATARGDELLRRLAHDTGGSFLRVRHGSLDKAFARIQQELRSQYLLAYTAARFAHDGSYHSISIKVRRRDVAVQHRKGYYAPHNTSR